MLKTTRKRHISVKYSVCLFSPINFPQVSEKRSSTREVFAAKMLLIFLFSKVCLCTPSKYCSEILTEDFKLKAKIKVREGLTCTVQRQRAKRFPASSAKTPSSTSPCLLSQSHFFQAVGEFHPKQGKPSYVRKDNLSHRRSGYLTRARFLFPCGKIV